MPLSAPAPRTALHRRVVECRGYERADGLWDIEGHLVDTKDYDFPTHDRGEVKAGVPVHEMWLRLTVDDSLTVQAAEAAMDHTPYTICPEIAGSVKALEGLTIRPGWNNAVRTRLGGVRGCTHLVELLGPLATAAFQTVIPLLERRRGAEIPSLSPGGRPALLDSCHALRADGPVAQRRWPAFARKPGEDA